MTVRSKGHIGGRATRFQSGQQCDQLVTGIMTLLTKNETNVLLGTSVGIDQVDVTNTYKSCREERVQREVAALQYRFRTEE